MSTRGYSGSSLFVVAAVMGVTASAVAQEPLPATPLPGPAPAASAAPASGAASEVLRDPAGVRGISPFWEALSEGDRAYLAQDFDAAIIAYRKAITSEPKNPLGHYRLGAVQVKKNEMGAAEEAWKAGLRFVTNETAVKAKLLFCLADLRERTKSYEEADRAWRAYADYVAADENAKAAKGHPATATERQRRITEHQRLQREYAAVKARADQRLKEAEEQSRKR